MGPQAYMSPKVYPDIQRVPTWCYLAVQARVEVRLLDGEEAKDALLKQLIADHEPRYAAQWRSLSEDYTHKMLQAITAFEMRVIDLQCSVKLNQHRPEAHASMHAAYVAGTSQEQSLAAWMKRLGLV
jgi:transcriptional regulator